MNDNTNNLIDNCFCNNDSHYDISLVCYEFFKNKFKYVGNNKWLYLNENNEWVHDIKLFKLIAFIRTDVCNAFIQRSLYWELNNDNDTLIIKKIISERLLQISYKLKNYNYISVIIKESKQFFHIE